MNGKTDEAIVTFEKLENFEGVTETTAKRKFEIYSKLNKQKEAINELQKLIDKHPTNIRYLNNLAGYYLEIGKEKEDSGSALHGSGGCELRRHYHDLHFPAPEVGYKRPQ